MIHSTLKDFKDIVGDEAFEGMTPKEVVYLWNLSTHNGLHDTHPRKPRPGSLVYPKLVAIFPHTFPSDPSSLTFTLIMIYYYILKSLNPEFPEYNLFDPICLVGLWSNELKQNYATAVELRNLVKFHFPPVGRSESSIRDCFSHFRIPSLAESSRWTKHVVLQYEGNKTLYDFLLFTKRDTIYLPYSATFTYKEPLKTKIITHFKKKDKNFKFNPSNSEALLDLFLQFVREETNCLEPLNKNFLLCNEGSFLQDTFEHRTLIHIGQILQALWMELELVLPPNMPNSKKEILLGAKENHLAIIAQFDKQPELRALMRNS